MNLQLKTNIKTEQLTNPIWHALISEHEFMAVGDDLARRYPADVSPFCALANQSAEAYSALTQIVNPDEALFTFLPEAPTPTSDWKVKTTFTLDQMAAFDFIPAKLSNDFIEILNDDAVPEMLALTKLTNPGPFKERTNRMGSYFGIWQEIPDQQVADIPLPTCTTISIPKIIDLPLNPLSPCGGGLGWGVRWDRTNEKNEPTKQLAAMAGERLNLSGFQEVSAVCAHPDFRGKGYARDLVSYVASRIVSHHKIPILHVLADNHRAISVYQSLGFKKSNTLHFAILQRAEQ